MAPPFTISSLTFVLLPLPFCLLLKSNRIKLLWFTSFYLFGLHDTMIWSWVTNLLSSSFWAAALTSPVKQLFHTHAVGWQYLSHITGSSSQKDRGNRNELNTAGMANVCEWYIIAFKNLFLLSTLQHYKSLHILLTGTQTLNKQLFYTFASKVYDVNVNVDLLARYLSQCAIQTCSQ